MNDTLTAVLALASALAIFVLAAVQLIKTTFPVDGRLVPLIGFGLGLLIGAAAYPFTDLALTLRLWAGGLAGLSATGLFELAFKKRE